MNSLKLKFLGLTGLILVTAIIGTAWYNLQIQQAILEKVAAKHARLVADTVRNNILADMTSGHLGLLANTLPKIDGEPIVDSLRIFDETGLITIADDPAQIGKLVATIDLLAFRNGDYHFTEDRGDHQHYNFIIPFENGPACSACHSAGRKLLGVLSVKLSLDDFSQMQARSRNATMIASGAMLLILALGITTFLLFYVDIPIRKLVTAMERAEQGDFQGARTQVTSSKEMTLLSSKFNAMMLHLRELMDTTVRHEREMAISQEKLAHAEELQSLNATLEGRLGEIEGLNINLEERIEEIEEANYRIADLASELEEKNYRLSQAVERLQALYQIGLAVNAVLNLPELFDQLCRQTTATLKGQYGYILMYDRATETLRIAGASGLAEGCDRDMAVPFKAGGVSFEAITTSRPILIEDIDQNPEYSKQSRLGFLRRSVICAPLTDQHEVVGSITIANPVDGSRFSSEDLELLSTIAAQASVAIRNANLYMEQEQTYISTVQALVSAIEASDAYTRGHSERVTRYSMALGRRMGLSESSLKNLERAAALHDIGKIGIDINILHKREKLTPADIEVLKQHPMIGVRILEPIHFLGDVRKIIEQHHERYDGLGYPLGLSADEWWPEAKILAVCDAFDAMTSDRPYRNALTTQVALQELRDQSGSQFDPEVAVAFVDMHGEDAPG